MLTTAAAGGCAHTRKRGGVLSFDSAFGWGGCCGPTLQVALRGNEVNNMLCKVLFSFIKHITEECPTCQGKGFHCELCVRPAVEVGRLLDRPNRPAADRGRAEHTGVFALLDFAAVLLHHPSPSCTARRLSG